jgi:molybdopterin-containing oxidoreductase family iron-sulfur binding subunit
MSESNRQPDMNRRKLLGATAAGVTAATLAPGVILQTVSAARNPGEPVTADVRWGMLIDTAKCADGCSACVDACVSENNIPSFGRPTTDPVWIRKVKLRDTQTGKLTNMPMLCLHCEFPPCVDVCPTGASFRRADGIVLVDRHTCIGCRYCMMACPYNARSFIHESIDDQTVTAPRGKGCVESCTLCVHRLDRGDISTACADACAKEGHEAILVGDLKDPESTLAKRLKSYPSREIRADLELNTGVRYSNV